MSPCTPALIKTAQRNADTVNMKPSELSLEQARTLARIRAFQPNAEVRLHDKPGGVVVELRRGHRAQAAFIDESGTFFPDDSLRPAA